jgi:hypothetical protein
MPLHHVHYTIDGHPCHYMAEGKVAEPFPGCLLDHDDNLVKDCTWHRQGYLPVEAFSPELFGQLQSIATDIVRSALESECDLNLNTLERYHSTVTDTQHALVAKRLKRVPHEAHLHFPLERIGDAVSKVLSFPVSSYNPGIKRHGCSIRMVRPMSKDYNPLHRDGWLERLRHGVNAYIPIAGSNPLSSLSLIPQSHYWKESDIQRTADGSIVNGMEFTVSSVISSVHGLNLIRPVLNAQEIMIFSPYLIHGGACNLNEDITRVSLEMRFWRKD